MELVEPETSNEDKTAAIVGYFGLIGLIIAIVLHNQKKTKIGAYHMRQSLGMMIASFAMLVVYFVLIFIPIVGWLLIPLIGLGFFALFIMGIINAVNGKFKPIPLIGQYFIKLLGTTFD